MKSYITAYDSYSCAGDTTALMEAIYNKQSGITTDTTYMPSTPVALGKMENVEFFTKLKEVVNNVLHVSNLENFNTTLLIVGSSVGGMAISEEHYFRDGHYQNIDPKQHPIAVIEEFLDKEFDFGASRSISTACTSSANAMLLAKRLIALEAYDNILIVGADALCYTTVCGFYALSVLSQKPCTPFQNQREGMNVSEGIAALLVQNKPTKGAVELCGVGGSSDAYHMTNPDPEAKGAMTAMQNALQDGGIQPEMVDYINAHGTGTQANDTVEAFAIEQLFGSNSYVSSTKAITGHTLGAAGALEAIISCEVLKRGLIPPQANSSEDIENKTLNIAFEPLQKELNYVLSNSFAFGGNNASVLFKRIEL